MKPLGPGHRHLLASVCKDLRTALGRTKPDSRLVVVRQHPWRTDTYGWAATIARFTGQRGADFEIWCDLFPNIGKPVFSIAFSATDRERVLRVARAHDAHRPKTADLDLDDLLPKQNDHAAMRRPLRAALFGKPLLEYYEQPFLTIYFRPTKGHHRPTTSELLSALMILVGAAGSGLDPKASADKDFPTVTERRLVKRHSAWERSPKLAASAKLRDGYICRVCGFSFLAKYGEVGRGFAEAHHIRPLSMVKSKRTKLTPDDLITVCANCHRMLHRMRGKKGDIARLQKLAKANKA